MIVTRSGRTSATPNSIERNCLSAALAVPQLARLELRQQRRVPRQHAERPVGARQLHFVHALVHERTVGRDDVQDERLRDHAASALAARSSTSSIVPAM